MTPHRENIEEYGKLCRERTNKSMIKNRQIQVVISLLIFLPRQFLQNVLWQNSAFLAYPSCFMVGNWQWSWSAYEAHAWYGWLDFVQFQGMDFFPNASYMLFLCLFSFHNGYKQFLLWIYLYEFISLASTFSIQARVCVQEVNLILVGCQAGWVNWPNWDRVQDALGSKDLCLNFGSYCFSFVYLFRFL